jgi:hypothetical protein
VNELNHPNYSIIKFARLVWTSLPSLSSEGMSHLLVWQMLLCEGAAEWKIVAEIVCKIILAGKLRPWRGRRGAGVECPPSNPSPSNYCRCRMGGGVGLMTGRGSRPPKGLVTFCVRPSTRLSTLGVVLRLFNIGRQWALKDILTRLWPVFFLNLL